MIKVMVLKSQPKIYLLREEKINLREFIQKGMISNGRYLILYHVITSCDSIYRTYTYVLLQILVFIRQFLRVTFLMVCFLSPFFSDSMRYFPILSYSLC